MKNNTIIYAGLFIVIVLLILIAVRGGSQGVNQQVPVGSSAANSSPAANVSGTPVPKSPGSAVPPPTGGYSSYQNYQIQISAGQDKCKTAANGQYDALYARTLQSSSFSSFYNQTNGLCFMKVTGSTQVAYSTTTTGHIYFRNVTRSTALAECTDPTGTLVNSSNWACTDKTTGQKMNLDQFNALVYTYVTK